MQTQQAIQIDSPNRFLSLNSRPVQLEDNHEPLSLHIPRRQSLQNLHPECPQDRLQFFRIFSTLVNMGNNVSREKDNKLSPYNRQLSSEQEMYQNKLNDLLWLELQAWLNKRSMQEQDIFVRQARDEYVAKILDEVLDFKVSYNDLDTGQRQLSMEGGGVYSPIKVIVEDFNGRFMNSIHEDRVFTQTAEERYEDDENHSFICTSPDHRRNLLKTVAQQKEALVQVIRLFQKLECIERLFPTRKAMGREFPVYMEEKFNYRIEALCVWLNITNDISHKLKLMAKVLHVDSLEKVQWPWLDYDSATFSQLASESVNLPPDVYTYEHADSDLDSESGSHSGYEEDDEGESDEDSEVENIVDDVIEDISSNHTSVRINGKNVRFILGSPEGGSSLSTSPTADSSVPVMSPPDSSTPQKQPTRTASMSSTISRTLSEMSLDSSPTAIYRYFADRNLKKMGMMKLIRRIQKLLEGTLKRSKQVLEKMKHEAQTEIISEVTMVTTCMKTVHKRVSLSDRRKLLSSEVYDNRIKF